MYHGWRNLLEKDQTLRVNKAPGLDAIEINNAWKSRCIPCDEIASRTVMGIDERSDLNAESIEDDNADVRARRNRELDIHRRIEGIWIVLAEIELPGDPGIPPICTGFQIGWSCK